VQDINISENHLSTLPEEIGSLAKLESLDFSENAMKELPSTFGGLKSLKVLIAFKNQVSSNDNR
jgi:Leucine-rich repeat (LRR) protein